jgi:hypothetical protein
MLIIGCAGSLKKEGTMLTSAEQLKQIIDYDHLPQPPVSLKPGFYFNSKDYPVLESLKMTEDTISLLENGVAMQHIVLEDDDTTLFFYFIVNSKSCTELRDKFIEFVSSLTSMTMDAFNSGPSGIGEFNIIRAYPSGKISNIVHFVRNNIGITVFVREGKFDIESLARQIDRDIQKKKDYNQDTIRSVSPHVSRIQAPDHDIPLNSRFETSIIMDENSEQGGVIYIFQYDDDMINMESEDGQHRTFTALMSGKTIINCTAVDRRTLLSTSKSSEINIVDK